MTKKPAGLRRQLTDYGDPGFSLFLRKAFAKSMGYTDAELDRPGDRYREHRQRAGKLPRHGARN